MARYFWSTLMKWLGAVHSRTMLEETGNPSFGLRQTTAIVQRCVYDHEKFSNFIRFAVRSELALCSIYSPTVQRAGKGPFHFFLSNVTNNLSFEKMFFS